MSGDDGFLSRWARRKAEVRREEAKPAAGDAQPPLVVPPDAWGAAPEFDLASLPSLDSLTASSDITIFLQKGVPDSLRNAALRMAWVSDPAIRDYVGPADFQWDFNAPGAITGYGELAPGIDITTMMSDISDGPLGKIVDAVEDLPQLAAPPAEMPTESTSASEEGVEPEWVAQADDAAQPQIPLPPPRKRHGSATPR